MCVLFRLLGVLTCTVKQGGQHEESWAPVQAAVNYATTMTVDGQNRDLVNYWQRSCVCAGDRLILRLGLVNVKRDGSALQAAQTREFQLTSYHERPVTLCVCLLAGCVPQSTSPSVSRVRNSRCSFASSGSRHEVAFHNLDP